MEQTVKGNTLDMLHEFYTLEAHMEEYGVEITDEQKDKITEAAKAFMENNSKEALNEMGATQEIVEEVLTLFTISDLMYNEIVADVDTNVSDEEANMRAYSMVTVSIDSHYDSETQQSIEYTDEEVAQLSMAATDFLTEAKNSEEDFATVAEAHEYKATSSTYDRANTTLNEEVKAALDAMSEGDDPQMITTDTKIYIFQLDKETDEEATENNRKSIAKKRQDEKYSAVLGEWQEDDGWEVDEAIWEEVVFDDFFTSKDASEAEGTEAE